MSEPTIDPTNTGDQQTAPGQTDGGNVQPTTPAEPVATPEDTAKITRLEQDRAAYAKVIEGLGLDANSDFVEKFNAGLIKPEDVLRQIQPQPQMPQAQMSPMETINSIVDKVQKEGATQEDFVDGLKAITQYIDGQEQSVNKANAEQLMTQCSNAAAGLLTGDELHDALPDSLKEAEKQLFVAYVADIVARDAYNTSTPERYYSPQVFESYAGKSSPVLTELRNHWIEYGKSLAINPATPVPPGTPTPTVPVNPMSPSQGGGAPLQPRERFTDVKQMSNAARAYVQQAAQV